MESGTHENVDLFFRRGPAMLSSHFKTCLCRKIFFEVPVFLETSIFLLSSFPRSLRKIYSESNTEPKVE